MAELLVDGVIINSVKCSLGHWSKLLQCVDTHSHSLVQETYLWSPGVISWVMTVRGVRKVNGREVRESSYSLLTGLSANCCNSE